MNVAILGVGMMGGSVAIALKRRHLAGRVVGYDRDRGVAERALALGTIDAIAPDAAQAARGADLVVLAVPVGAMPSLFAQIAGSLAAGALVTDLGSTKLDVTAAAQRALGPAFERFVPSHPIAGSERAGPESADPDLLEARVVVTTPSAQTRTDALERIEALWRACGARIERMDAARHDRILAAVSHLPHLLAFALVERIGSQADAQLKLSLAGAGFRDFTRIAASSPAMWRDIVLANREPLGAELRAFMALLAEIARAVDEGDSPWLEALFERASRLRRQAPGGADGAAPGR